MIDRPFVKESDTILPEVDAVFEGDDDAGDIKGFVPFVPKERLMRGERETSIGGTAEERINGQIRVFSNDPVWVNRFLRKGYKPYDISGDSHFFIIPTNAITVRSAFTLSAPRAGGFQSKQARTDAASLALEGAQPAIAVPDTEEGVNE